jgi:inosine-uridine nucleoside N-ribohydrolase
MKKIYSILAIFSICIFNLYAQKQKVWLDADTGNEMDDLYAIVKLVKADHISLVGLSSAHFNNADLLVFDKWNDYQTKGINSIHESQILNEQILSVLDRTDIAHPRGADRQIGRAWGQDEPRPSDASSAIIAEVKKLNGNEKLDILTIGAMTNIATVLKIDPSIKSKIRVFSLGARYNPKTKVWNKNEFNIRNDLNAFDYLLNLSNFDFTIMPLEPCFPFKFDREVTFKNLNDNIPIHKILKDRWIYHANNDPQRTMWDLALVDAYLMPNYAKMVVADKPKENSKGKIKVYTSIDTKYYEADFWNVIKALK